MAPGLEESPPQLTPLLASKLVRPRIRGGTVSRPRLFAALNRLQEAELTLLAAPAGSGKTSLVASWLDTRPEVPVAWVSLDPSDDDPVRLWTYICKAVERVSGGPAESALALLKGSGSPVQTAIDELHNGLGGLADQLVLVLDDLHHVRSRDSLRLLIYAIERLPGPIRVVAMSNHKGGIEFGGLRGRGKLAEIPAAELDFVDGEAQELLLAGGGIELSEPDLGLLMRRTEGWATGLTLAVGGLSATPSPSIWIQHFTGAEGTVADYLTTEVLDGADAGTRRFLLQTSAFDTFTAGLCDALLEEQDAKALLRGLQKTNLFLVPLAKPGSWFRYHPMLGDLLREEHERTAPGEATLLRVGAAHWLLAGGHVDEAIAQILAVDDQAQVGDFLVAGHLTFIRSGRLGALMDRIDALPAIEVAARPILAAAGSLVAALVGRPPARREQLARMAEHDAVDLAPEERKYVLAVVSMTRAMTPTYDLGTAIKHAERAVEFSQEYFGELTVPALAGLAGNLYMAGDFVGARSVSQEAVAQPEATERPHGLVQAHAVHSLTESSAGQTSSGEAEARHAIAVARQSGTSEAWSAGLAHHALGYSLLLTQQTAEAEREFQRAEALLKAPEPRLDHAQTLLFLAQAHISRGKLSLATSELGLATEQLAAFTDAGYLPMLARDVQDRLNTAQEGREHELEPPSPAEWAVLRLMESDLSQRAIADQLFLSQNTVKTHTANLYRKLGVHSREAAVARGRMAGLLKVDSEGG